MKPARFLMTALAMALVIPTITAQKGKPPKPQEQPATLDVPVRLLDRSPGSLSGGVRA